MVPGKSTGASAKKAGWNQMSLHWVHLASPLHDEIPEPKKQNRPWKKHQVRNGLWFFIYSVVTEAVISFPSYIKEVASIYYLLTSQTSLKTSFYLPFPSPHSIKPEILKASNDLLISQNTRTLISTFTDLSVTLYGLATCVPQISLSALASSFHL